MLPETIHPFKYVSSAYDNAMQLLHKAGPDWVDIAVEGAKVLLPKQIAYDAIMTAHNGDPTGVEHHNHKGRYGFVLADASIPGKHRIQLFDQHGFISHETYDTLEEAVFEMASQGYTQEEIGALSRLSKTASWQKGMQVQGLMQQYNAGEITYRELDVAIAAATSTKPEQTDVQ